MKLSEAIAALERGEEVEYKASKNYWFPLTDTSGFTVGSAINWQFRLKPKSTDPLKLWVNIYDHGFLAYDCLDHAKVGASSTRTSRIAIPFHEVVPLTDEESSRLRDLIQTYKNDRHFTNVSFLLDLLKKQGVE